MRRTPVERESTWRRSGSEGTASSLTSAVVVAVTGVEGAHKEFPVALDALIWNW